MAIFAPVVVGLGGVPTDSCSEYQGDATLNEIIDLGNTQQIEVRLLDATLTATTYDDWTVGTCVGNDCQEYDLDQAVLTDKWLLLDVDKNDLKLEGGASSSIGLFDEDGEYIDYLSINGGDALAPANCDDFPYDTNAISDSQFKALFRSPDGVGAWTQPENPGAGATTTPGGSNDEAGVSQAVDASSREHGGDGAALYTRVVGTSFGITVRYRAGNDDPEPSDLELELTREDGNGGCGETLVDEWGRTDTWQEDSEGYVTTLTGLSHDRAEAAARVRMNLTLEPRSTGSGNSGGWCGWFPWWPGCDGGGNDDPQPVTLEYCSSDAFTLRPEELSLSARNAAGESLTRNDWSGYAPTSCGAEACQAAGEDFTLEVEATPTGQGFDADIQLEEQMHPEAPAWMTPGTLAVALAFDGTTDRVETTVATYPEAGLLAVDAHDGGAFAAVDRSEGHCVAGEAGNAFNADGLVGCRAALTEPELLGRFIPAHFAVVDAGIENRMERGCSVDDGFTYLGEALAARVTLEARNVAEVATENYRGQYASLSALDWSVVAPEAENGHLDGRLELVRDTSGWEQGQASFTPEVTVARADDPDGPFSADIAFVATDADGVSLEDDDLDVDRNGDDVDDHRSAGGTSLRYGRLAIERLTAASFSAVELPLRAEYWDGDRFEPNESDDCTPLELRYRSQARGGDPEAAEWEGQPALGELALRESLPPRLEAGGVAIPFSAPGNRGEVAVCADLEDHAYLHRGANEDLPEVCQGSPRGSVWYGISSGNENVLYTREVFD